MGFESSRKLQQIVDLTAGAVFSNVSKPDLCTGAVFSTANGAFDGRCGVLELRVLGFVTGSMISNDFEPI